MRSLRFVGKTGVGVLAMAMMSANSALAQTQTGDCSSSSTTHDRACQFSDVALVGVGFFFNTWSGRSIHASGGRSSITTSPGVEYFRGRPPIDVFHVALMGSPVQNAAEDDHLFMRLFWQGQFLGGAPGWWPHNAPTTFSPFAGDDEDDSPGPGSRGVGNAGSPGSSDDGGKDSPWVHQVTSLDPPVTALDPIVTSLDPVPVISNPEPASIVLFATGLAGLASAKMRRRRSR